MSSIESDNFNFFPHICVSEYPIIRETSLTIVESYKSLLFLLNAGKANRYFRFKILHTYL